MQFVLGRMTVDRIVAKLASIVSKLEAHAKANLAAAEQHANARTVLETLEAEARSEVARAQAVAAKIGALLA